MAVDELGLWVIHADAEYGGNLVITKLEIGKVLLLLHIHSSVKKVLSIYIYIIKQASEWFLIRRLYF